VTGRLRAGARLEGLIALVVAVAFLARVIVSLRRGEAGFLEDGYAFYAAIATNFLNGHGLCLAADSGCAVRMPLYPLLIAAFLKIGWLFPGLSILQSAIGAAAAYVAWRLGRELFDTRAGLLAATLTALNPYAVVHDSALQETVVINAFIAWTVLFLIRSLKSESGWPAVLAGTSLGFSMLTASRLALLLPLTVVALMWVGGTLQVRLRRAALVALPIAILVGGWAARNYQVVGTPTLTTETGLSFWLGNNATTFDFFPERSIDLNQARSLELLPPDQLRLAESLDGQEVARDAVLGRFGLSYVLEHPGTSAWNMVRKVAVPAAAYYSPVASPLNWYGYLALFGPIHVLAAIALWRARRRVLHAPVFILLAAFFATTAVFWAHTSHKSVLDPILFVYASSTALAFRGRGPNDDH
jgi:hypothetical protein